MWQILGRCNLIAFQSFQILKEIFLKFWLGYYWIITHSSELLRILIGFFSLLWPCVWDYDLGLVSFLALIRKIEVGAEIAYGVKFALSYFENLHLIQHTCLCWDWALKWGQSCPLFMLWYFGVVLDMDCSVNDYAWELVKFSSKTYCLIWALFKVASCYLLFVRIKIWLDFCFLSKYENSYSIHKWENLVCYDLKHIRRWSWVVGW